MMLVVTGANGFIGSALVWDLTSQGYNDILCVDHISPELTSRPLHYLNFSRFCYANDFFDTVKTENIEIEAVFHMGACSSTTETNEQYLQQNNTEYTRKIWDLCKELNCPLIYASSAAIYGDGKEGFSDREPTQKYKPLNLYGWSKHHFDTWAEAQSSSPPSWHGFRFFNVYGPNEYHKESMASVVYKAFLQIQQTGSLQLFRSHHPNFEDGKQQRDFVYVKDVTTWMIEVYKSKRVNNGIYNMGFGACRTWLDLATSVFKVMGRPLEIEWIDIPENIRNQYQYHTEADMIKFNEQGLTPPKWNLESGIKDYIENYLLSDQPQLRNE
ncbi:MAG: ADP-glyceromanno-heptose 6-epimerase [Bdellovibrionales bacterium]